MSERRKYIKNGNPNHFTYFNDETVRRMTPAQKALWTLATDELPSESGIPDEVQDFMTPKEPVPKEKPESVPGAADDLGTSAQEKEPEKEPDADFYRERLKEMGIRVAHNAKKETLKNKYRDAIAGIDKD